MRCFSSRLEVQRRKYQVVGRANMARPGRVRVPQEGRQRQLPQTPPPYTRINRSTSLRVCLRPLHVRLERGADWIEGVAEILHGHEWECPYDYDRLAANKIPVYAVSFASDMHLGYHRLQAYGRNGGEHAFCGGRGKLASRPEAPSRPDTGPVVSNEERRDEGRQDGVTGGCSGDKVSLRPATSISWLLLECRG